MHKQVSYSFSSPEHLFQAGLWATPAETKQDELGLAAHLVLKPGHFARLNPFWWVYVFPP